MGDSKRNVKSRKRWQWRSPIGYQASIPGAVHVLQAGKAFKKVATNQMGETCYASPAISDGRLFIRTRSHLFCIGTRSN